jgi:hypothetical protein
VRDRGLEGVEKFNGEMLMVTAARKREMRYVKVS